MITEEVVVLRKGAILSAACETKDSDMVMTSSANFQEKDMILLHSATTAPSSTQKAELQASGFHAVMASKHCLNHLFSPKNRAYP